MYLNRSVTYEYESYHPSSWPVGHCPPAASQGGIKRLRRFKSISQRRFLQQPASKTGDATRSRKSPTQRNRYGFSAPVPKGSVLGIGAYHNGDSRPCVLSFHTFFRRVKKVCRLPAGTGEVEVKTFDLSSQLTAFSSQLSACSPQPSTFNFNTAGWRPRPALYSFCLPKKSKQKKGTPAPGPPAAGSLRAAPARRAEMIR